MREIIKLIPNVKKNGLKGGVIYHDGQFDDARMAISLAQTAENHGATLINYFGVEDLIKENEMIAGVVARDSIENKSYKIMAKGVINATGFF